MRCLGIKKEFFGKGTEDKKDNKHFNVLLSIIGIFLIPFVYPSISKILIELDLFDDVQEINEYIKTFTGYTCFLIASLIIVVLYEFRFGIAEIISKFVSNFDMISYKYGDSELQLTNKHREEAVKLSENAKKEARDILFEKENKNSKTKCQECKKDEIIEERDILRNFSAYHVTNKYSRDLLKRIKDFGKIDKVEFEMQIQNYYEKTIRNMSRTRRKAFATKKVKDLLCDLKYLNIIECTEDDKFIILTQNGINFINGQYSEEVG